MSSSDYRVIIPQEEYQLVNFRQEDFPGVMILNKALGPFEPKIVFSWHLSLMIDCVDLIDNGMPSAKEREVLEPFGDLLDTTFKGGDADKPNALFLARITWNKTRELIYRVFDPEPIQQFLQKTIEDQSFPRNFDYRMENDPEWKLAAWHLGVLKTVGS